jgi:hypothetical protein
VYLKKKKTPGANPSGIRDAGRGQPNNFPRGSMKKRIPNWSPDQDCFFCGAENPIGLKLDFYLDEETKEVTTECVPSKLFTGFGNILHGVFSRVISMRSWEGGTYFKGR